MADMDDATFFGRFIEIAATLAKSRIVKPI